MAQITKEIIVDVSRENRFRALVAKQNDVESRFIKATICSEGVKIEISSAATVTINAERADGTSKAFAGTVNTDGTVTVPLTSWMLELAATLRCSISVVGTDQKLTTMTFYVFVEAAEYEGDSISEDENYDLLVSLISECKSATASALAAAGGGKMQLIRQITTTEALGSVTISADTEGDALSLDRFCLLIQFPATITLGQQTGNCVLSVYANGYTANCCLHYQAAVERAKYVRLEGEIMGAAGDAPRCLTSMAVGSDNIFGNSMRTAWYGSGFAAVKSLIISGTIAGSNAAGIPSGTVLTLYGRRA